MSDGIKTTAEAIEAAVLPEAYAVRVDAGKGERVQSEPCLLYTSPSPRD